MLFMGGDEVEEIEDMLLALRSEGEAVEGGEVSRFVSDEIFFTERFEGARDLIKA